MKYLAILFLSLAAIGLSGCGTPERVITPQEEEMFRHPPKNPPAGYHGGTMTPPAGPPAGATPPASAPAATNG